MAEEQAEQKDVLEDASTTSDPDSEDTALENPVGEGTAEEPSSPVDGQEMPQEQIPDLPDFSGMVAQALENSIELIKDVDLNVKIELGRTEMTVNDILKLNEGAVVELDKLAGDPVDVLVNEQLVARGEVLVLNDNFCVRINEIIPGIAERMAQE